MHEGVSSILESLKAADMDGAKRKISDLSQVVRTDREKGSLLAAAGIYASMSKAKQGTMLTWDSGRLERAAKSIVSSQMADEFDQGYAETLIGYSKLTQSLS